MSKPGISAPRRMFLRTALASAPAALAAAGAADVLVPAQAAENPPPYTPKFFQEPHWSTLQRLVDVLIPPGDEGPGGLEAGVAEFIDQQMDTPYGQGKLWYMDGPHDPKAPGNMGYQLPYAPRDLYPKALAAFEAAVRQAHGKPFAELDADAREGAVSDLEQGKLALTDDIPAAAFFALLLQNVHEGYFCDPVHGGNKGMAAWKMVGFPGARGDYYDWVDQYSKKYPLGPVSIR
ncbi:gluconate 2-dehydrogenase subunit 3 family protein [Pigmentiphaga soli]|uniref:Gluconate 2-dehydrogenase subunit 3 family protein n=1 Tax=Pigmentiphaga soli TaxID=1007095 RepID=A0ABP8HKG4_9BURK